MKNKEIWVVSGLWGGSAILSVLGCFFFAQGPLRGRFSPVFSPPGEWR